MSEYNTQMAIIQFLQGNIQVFQDDGVTPITGEVTASWFNEELFKNHDWQVSVGPFISENEVLDVGAYNKLYTDTYDAVIWVLKKRNPVGYTPRRLAHSIAKSIEEICFQLINDIKIILGDIDHINCTGWTEIPDDKEVIRFNAEIELDYQKSRPKA